MATTNLIRTVDDVIAAQQRGERVKFLHFWGHRPAADGAVSASCFSQWWPAAFTVDGVRYPTAEHFMMAAKARLFGDADTEAMILAAGHPRQAKVLGREVRPFDEEAWARHRFGFVVRGNEAKFGQSPALARFLLGTGDRVLVEASPVDRVWGIGLAARDEGAFDAASWRGLNLLGFALMEARDRLRSAGGPAA